MKAKRGRSGTMAVKIDMHKAYDRLEWGFILKILKCFGFSDKWVRLIHQCISTVSYSVLLNGSLHGFFQPQRGLCQGDPLSPFLFIIASGVLSLFILQAESWGMLHGHVMARGAPYISHLMLADDLIIFCKANNWEAKVLDSILVR